MNDWTEGYVADVNYTFGYYQELNPLLAKLAFVQAGLAAPEIYNACELGFGQGVSVNVHAAASSVHWHGTDFNPHQVCSARALAKASGANARLYDDSFEQFVCREDLPKFDYIGLHGIWSWISDTNRQMIVDFINKKLRVGGVLYISYNTLPGWSSFTPMRHMMTEYDEIMGSQGIARTTRIDQAISFGEKLLEISKGVNKALPAMSQLLKTMKTQDRLYLAHEYFNRDWDPMYFSQIATWLESAKLSYVGSASGIDQMDKMNLTREQKEFVDKVPNPTFRESIRDFMVNRKFRKDYWVKGGRKLNQEERMEAFRGLKVILGSAHDDIDLKVKGVRGEAKLNENMYRPVLEKLSSFKPYSILEIETAVQGSGITITHLFEIVVVLASLGHIYLVQDEAEVEASITTARKLNSYICAKAIFSKEIGCLSSPITGGGIHVSRLEQLFIYARNLGHKKPNEWAEFVWTILEKEGVLVQKDGAPLIGKQKNLEELIRLAIKFSQKRLPILTALLVS